MNLFPYIRELKPDSELRVGVRLFHLLDQIDILGIVVHVVLDRYLVELLVLLLENEVKQHPVHVHLVAFCL